MWIPFLELLEEGLVYLILEQFALCSSVVDPPFEAIHPPLRALKLDNKENSH